MTDCSSQPFYYHRMIVSLGRGEGFTVPDAAFPDNLSGSTSAATSDSASSSPGDKADIPSSAVATAGNATFSEVVSTSLISLLSSAYHSASSIAVAATKIVGGCIDSSATASTTSNCLVRTDVFSAVVAAVVSAVRGISLDLSGMSEL